MRKYLVAGLGLLLLLVTVAWAGEGAGALATRPASETAEPTLPKGDPAICVWDGGIHMLGIKPYVVFAVW